MMAVSAAQQSAQQPPLFVLQTTGAEPLVLFVPLLGFQEQLPGNDGWHGHSDPFVLGAEFFGFS